MLSGQTKPPNRPSKDGPDDDRRFHWSKRRNTDNTDEGCSKTKNLTSSNTEQHNKSLQQTFINISSDG